MRTRLLLLGFFAITMVGSASPARAQDKEHGNAPAAHGTAGHDDGGHAKKPALLEWDFGSAIWSIIVFVVLLVILRATAWKPILGALQQREKFIADSLSEARRDREEAKRLMAEYAAKIEQARVDATAIVEEGRRDAEAVQRQREEEANRKMQETVARAQRDIKMAQEAAIADLYTRSLELATGVAGKIIRKQLSPTDHRALLDESVAELSKAGKN